jgi:hypothetical protein
MSKEARRSCIPYSQAVRVRKEYLERVCGQERDWNTFTRRRCIGRRYTRQKLFFPKFATEWEHWEPEDRKLKDPIRTHWLEDEEIDKLERKRAKKSIEKEEEWWDKDGEEGHTSEYDHFEWDWDNAVMGKDEGNLDNDKGSILDAGGNQLDGIRRRESKTMGTEVVMTIEKKLARKKITVVRRRKGNYQAGHHGERKEVGCEKE